MANEVINSLLFLSQQLSKNRMKEYIDGNFYQPVFICPHWDCKTKTDQYWYKLHFIYDKNGTSTAQELDFIHICKCRSCEKLSLWFNKSLMYPKIVEGSVTPNNALNEDAKDVFKEAVLIIEESPRASCALLRLCIEILCNQLEAKGEDLEKKIDYLVKEMGLPNTIKDALHIVRVYGNEAVHPGVIDLKDNYETAKRLLELVNLIAEYTIVNPNKINTLLTQLPRSKMQQIKSKDKKGES